MFFFLYGPALTTVCDHWEDHSLDKGPIRTFVGRVMSLLFNILSRLVIAFLPRSSHLLISWLQSLSKDFGAQEEEICRYFPPSPFYLPCSNGGGCYDLSVFNTNPKPALSLSSFTLTKRLFSSASLSAARVVSSANLRLLTFPSPILILWAENSLDVSNFLVEISSLSPFVVFFYC